MGRITTLVENSRIDTHLAAEHGLSLFIETGRHSLLFDTGQSPVFSENAKLLGMDLNAVECVVLSHGHYDHCGGLRTLFAEVEPKTLVLGTSCLEPKYAVEEDQRRFIGCGVSHEELRENGWTVQEIAKDKTPLFDRKDGIWVLTGFPRTHAIERIPKRFKCLDEHGRLHDDLFNDEIMLVLESERGLIVVVGCSHPGIMNMLDQVSACFKQPIYLLVGGTHLRSASDQHIAEVSAYLKKQQIPELALSHCTGETSIIRMAEHGLVVRANMTGSVIEW